MWLFGFFSFTVDTPLREVFEEDSLFKDELLSRHATIRDLLAHRMGIPSNNAIRLDTNLTRENLIKYGKYTLIIRIINVYVDQPHKNKTA